MKKYILLLVTALSFAQASNQMVSFTQAQSLGFALKSGQSHTTSNQCMTKADILTKYNVTISGYTDTQLVPKSAWTNVAGNYLFYYAGSFHDRASACSYASDYLILYSNTTTLSNGSVVYTNSGLTNVFIGNGAFYKFSDDNSTANINASGVVSSIISCTVPVGFPNSFSAGNTVKYGDCGTGMVNTFYSNTSIDVGVTLYTNDNLSTPVLGGDKWYYNQDGYVYRVNNSGLITEIALCL